MQNLGEILSWVLTKKYLAAVNLLPEKERECVIIFSIWFRLESR